jgi:sRNA-binding carbon storage regulator CsrA
MTKPPPPSKPHETGTLILDIRMGEVLSLDGGRIMIELIEKSGKLAKLRITAPKSISITKGERQ